MRLLAPILILLFALPAFSATTPILVFDGNDFIYRQDADPSLEDDLDTDDKKVAFCTTFISTDLNDSEPTVLMSASNWGTGNNRYIRLQVDDTDETLTGGDDLTTGLLIFRSVQNGSAGSQTDLASAVTVTEDTWYKVCGVITVVNTNTPDLTYDLYYQTDAATSPTQSTRTGVDHSWSNLDIYGIGSHAYYNGTGMSDAHELIGSQAATVWIRNPTDNEIIDYLDGYDPADIWSGTDFILHPNLDTLVEQSGEGTPNWSAVSNPTQTGTRTVTSYDCDCGSTDSAAPCRGDTVSYTITSTITYNFLFNDGTDQGGSVSCGKFANEYDYWVAPPVGEENGSIDITGMTPAATFTGSSLHSGWMRNPDSQLEWGMDGRNGMLAGEESNLNPTVGTPVTIDTGAEGTQSIIKSISDTDTGASNCESAGSDGHARNCFLHHAILTVLASTPSDAGTTAMRPAYFGADKPMVLLSQVDWDLLPTLTPPVMASLDTTIEDWDDALAALEAPKLDWGNHTLANEGLIAFENWGYSANSAYWGNPFGHFSTYAFQILYDASGADIAKRDLLRIHYLQYAIDQAAVIMEGGEAGSEHEYGGAHRANGGYGYGRYVPFLVAAVLIDDGVDRLGYHADLFVDGVSPTDLSDLKKQSFAELNQITPGLDDLYYGSKANVVGGKSYKYPATCGTNNFSVIEGVNVFDGNNEDCVSQCPGAYQPITWPGFWNAASMIRLIPAVNAIADPELMSYVERMIDDGVVCDPDDIPWASNGGNPYRQNTGPDTYGTCNAPAANIGRACINHSDCGTGGNCTRVSRIVDHNALYSSQYFSESSMHAWFEYDSCYADCSCAGMEHLESGGACITGNAESPFTVHGVTISWLEEIWMMFQSASR